MSKGRVLTKKKWGHCARYWRKYKYRIKFPRGKLNSFEGTHTPIGYPLKYLSWLME